MRWIISAALSTWTSIVCYLTNWFVLLFADEVGELHGIFRYWQTWDDSCGVRWFVKETVPNFLRYDFDLKYISLREITPELARVGRSKGCVQLRDGASFSLKERIQRYFCRLLWLTRNCGYGFSFWLFGVDMSGFDINVIRKEEGLTLARGIYDAGIFIYHDTRKMFSVFGYDIYRNFFLGWKLDIEAFNPVRSMIANRIAFKIRKANKF